MPARFIPARPRPISLLRANSERGNHEADKDHEEAAPFAARIAKARRQDDPTGLLSSLADLWKILSGLRSAAVGGRGLRGRGDGVPSLAIPTSPGVDPG
jgi:hypothetical protein